MKILDVIITCRLLLIFPEIFGNIKTAPFVLFASSKNWEEKHFLLTIHFTGQAKVGESVGLTEQRCLIHTWPKRLTHFYTNYAVSLFGSVFG